MHTIVVDEATGSFEANMEGGKKKGKCKTRKKRNTLLFFCPGLFFNTPHD
jgi:hypothetical protein